MDILFLLIPLSVVLALAIGVAFWWAVRSGQFEDLEGPAHRVLLDDDDRPAPAPGTAATDAGSASSTAGRSASDGR